MPMRSARLVTAILVLGSAMAPAAEAAAPPSIETAALGELSSFRAIAADTLGFAEKDQIESAQKRGTDLETAWDDAEDKLKPTDPTRWRVVDKAIDRVLAELRAGKPDQRKITSALKDLLTAMDKGGAA